MIEHYEVVQAVIEVVGFLGGVIFAVTRIVSKTEMLSQVIEQLSGEIKSLRRSLNDITESHQDHNVRIVRLETVIGKDSHT